ncbi:MAG: hypothetical protein AB7E61_06240 [Acholeplasmataceae bacterium]
MNKIIYLEPSHVPNFIENKELINVQYIKSNEGYNDKVMVVYKEDKHEQ